MIGLNSQLNSMLLMVLMLPSNSARQWHVYELELVEVIADQVAVALYHAAILEESVGLEISLWNKIKISLSSFLFMMDLKVLKEEVARGRIIDNRNPYFNFPDCGCCSSNPFFCSTLPHPISSDHRAGSSTSAYKKDEYDWRYDSDELPDNVVRASSALENLQLDRKARNLTTSWRHAGDGISKEGDHM